MSHNLAFWTAFVVGGFIVYGIWLQSSNRWTVKIVADERGVQSHSGVPSARVSRIIEFFEQTLSIESRCVVLARRDSSGYIRTKIKGSLDMGTQQQIRNFLMTLL